MDVCPSPRCRCSSFRGEAIRPTPYFYSSMIRRPTSIATGKVTTIFNSLYCNVSLNMA